MPPGKVIGSTERKLIKLFSNLDAVDQASLLAFAEFLAQRSRPESVEIPSAEPIQPEEIARPERESVVLAIKRLSRTYRMLDTSDMLDQTSSLMSSHVLQGRAAHAVIDDLEKMFLEHYNRYRDSHSE